MDQLSLGDLDTTLPILGHLNSEYGYRDHPINGTYQFHGGVDIGGQSGDSIGAFAAGTVEYIGEDDSYGLYLQIDHGNGVKSFYAHCKKLCVSKGQTVSAGEKVAEVGSTGSATGPHLHFELKYNKLHLNPAYYLEFLPRT
jgi:murein DD-endopeptidase MepM/ murein hydrolase activator NlpD